MSGIAVLAGTAAAAAAIIGVVKMTSPKVKKDRGAFTIHSPPFSPSSIPPRKIAPSPPTLNEVMSGRTSPYRGNRKTPTFEDDMLIPRDKSGNFAYTESASSGFMDQDWQSDCCGPICNSRDPRNSLLEPPLDDQYLGKAVGTLGDFVPSLQTDTDRDASNELNEPPHPTRTTPDYALGWGEPLEGERMPYGASEATDLEFWGPREWQAERAHKIPDYLFDKTGELDGKEINRPFDTYYSDWERESTEAKVEHSTGFASDRTPDVRLQSLNRYGQVVTTRPFENPKFLPPRATGGRFSGMPGMAPGRVYGARLMHLFNAFLPWKGASAGTNAPPIAPIILPPSTRRADDYSSRTGNAHRGAGGNTYGEEGKVNVIAEGRIGRTIDFEYRQRAGNLFPGGGASAGEDTNPVRGGVIRRIAGQWDQMGNAGYEVGGCAGVETNPPEGGYNYATRERIARAGDVAQTRGSPAGNGPIILADMAAGARGQKDISGRADYSSPASGQGKYGGHGGISLTTRRSGSDFAFPLILSGNKNSKGSPNMLWTIGGNPLRGYRGGDFDNSPPKAIGEEAMKSTLYENIVGKRSEEAFDDLFSVRHS